MLINNILLLLFIAVRLDHMETKTQFSIVGNKIECLTNTPFVSNLSCEIKHFNSTTSLWSLDLYFAENVTVDNIFVKISWFYKTANDIKFKPFLGINNITTDLCRYLNHGNSMLVDMFIDDVKKNSNLFHPCPFHGHCYVRDLNPSTKRWPPIIPSGEYFMWFIFYTKINKTEPILMSAKAYVDVKTIR